MCLAAVRGDQRAVRGHRQPGDRAEVRQHLVAPVRARGQHGGRAGLRGQPGQRPRPGLRRVAVLARGDDPPRPPREAKRAWLDHVHVGGAVAGERIRRHVRCLGEHNCPDRRVPQAPGQRQRP